MMKRTFIFLSSVLLMISCGRQNPFLSVWDTPYGIPPYDKIQVRDYLPAIQQGIAEQDAEIQAIVDNPEVPSFDNTVAPLELSGRLLSNVNGVLFNVSETDRSDALDKVVEDALPLLSAHEDNISFNKELFRRIEAVYNGDTSGLTREQYIVLEKHYRSFIREGVGLDSLAQNELRDINTQLALKIQKIGNNILAESNAFAQKFGFSVSSYPEKMTTTEDRELRRQYNLAYTSRGNNGNENDNCALILEVMSLRIRKANLLGYQTSASYTLENKMAHDPATVDTFLAGIMAPAVARAKQELADMQEMMDADVAAGLLPEGSVIEPWDWWYYAEKVRRAKYDLDDDQVRAYFNINRVREGIFKCANILYGINAEALEGVPSYNSEKVQTWKITDEDGSLVGIFTTDYFPRESKRGGAWMNNVREQYLDADGNDVRPIICNVGNLPEYLTVDDVQTAFHEFGHALHGLLSRCNYCSVSGTNVTRDFVEMFSQFNENWAFQPELLSEYALNDSGEVIPAELVEKIHNSSKFNQGFMTTELCAASILDMKWHELTEIPAQAFENPAEWIARFESEACNAMGLIPEIAPRYRTTYFNHIFSSGYNSGYYGYLWAEVLDKDAFDIFCKSDGGPWNIGLARQFKQTFLEKGGSDYPMSLYKSFAGREPESDAMLRARGLK